MAAGSELHQMQMPDCQLLLAGAASVPLQQALADLHSEEEDGLSRRTVKQVEKAIAKMIERQKDLLHKERVWSWKKPSNL